MNKNILIKSSDRASGSSHDFKFNSHSILDGKYLIKNILIPNAMYNVTSSNNTFILYEDSSNKTITIPSGNYNVTTLAAALQTAFNAVSSGYNTFTVTYDSITATFTTSAGLAFYFIFPDSKTANTYGYSDLTTASGTSTTSDNVINLSYPSSLGIEITETNIDNYENSSTMASGNIYVPLNVGFGFYKSLTSDDFTQHIQFKKTRTLSIKIVDTSDNSSVDLNGVDWELLLSRV